jgi:hypothetical protein
MTKPSDNVFVFEDVLALADPSTWVEPRAGLEEDVVQAVAAAPPRLAGGGRKRRRVAVLGSVVGLAAAAAIAVAFFVGATVKHSDDSITYAAQLGPTQLAPAAHASAGVSHSTAGFRVTVDAHDLPQLHDGQYFQAWLKNDAGVEVPIGTFSSSNDYVTLWSGVTPDAFHTMTVTIEATDNDQASSENVVLTGELQHR